MKNRNNSLFMKEKYREISCYQIGDVLSFKWNLKKTYMLALSYEEGEREFLVLVKKGGKKQA